MTALGTIFFSWIVFVFLFTIIIIIIFIITLITVINIIFDFVSIIQLFSSWNLIPFSASPPAMDVCDGLAALY